jgi:RimK family alpha-L-glutamate ligase
MRFFVAAEERTATNLALVAAFEGCGLDAAVSGGRTLPTQVRSGDAVLGRFDVLPTLDGVQSCLWDLRRVVRRGVRVLNDTGALLAAHDKLVTATRLGRAGLPHPRTAHVDGSARLPDLGFPVVVKPRFGSWGRDVVLCESPRALERCLRQLARRNWFGRQGALLQEFLPSQGRDLRLIVAGGRIVGAIERVAAPGEWRTNVALGAARRAADPSPAARALALAAVGTIGGSLVGVDLLPVGEGYVVLELNGAVDFTSAYSLDGDVFEEAARALVVAATEHPQANASLAQV